MASEVKENVFKEFASSTTAHGFARAAGSFGVRRAMWILFILGGLTMASLLISSRVRSYLDFDSTTVMKRHYNRSLEFPAVTICNYNRWLLDKVDGKERDFLQGIMKYIDGVPDSDYNDNDQDYEYSGGASGSGSGDYGEDEYSGDGSDTRRYRHRRGADGPPVNFSTPYAMDTFTLTNGWHLDKGTLMQCSFGGEKCKAEQFTHIFTKYGNCYTFNADGHGKRGRRRLKQGVPGPAIALSLAIDIQPDQYAESNAFAGNDQEGLRFQIHSIDEPPDVQAKGISVGVGFHAFASMSMTRYSNLEHPWGDCDKSRSLKNFAKYSYSGCAADCMVREVNNKCSCKPFYLKGDDIPNCTPEESVYCANKVIKRTSKHFSDICGCPVACEYDLYDTRLSYVRSPNEQRRKEIVQTYNVTEDFWRKHVVTLDVYFDEMSYLTVTEVEAMTLPALISDIGGQLGLWIGMSALTMVEVVEFLVLLCTRCCHKRRNKNPKQNSKGDDLEEEELQSVKC